MLEVREDLQTLQTAMDDAVELAKQNSEGSIANYIPELASVPEELTAVSVTLADGTVLTSGDATSQLITLQSTAKLVILIGLLEELGSREVMKWVKVEPSGDDFSSVARLDQFGPKPSNPMLNSGAIALSAHIPGNAEEKLVWLENWMEKLFGEKLRLDHKVYASEKRTGDRNRALAYLLNNYGMLAGGGSVNEVLDTYFYLCSFEATVKQASYLPTLLATGGLDPNGTRILSKDTIRLVLSIMCTCGLYNETGTHMVRTGMPAKSSVSGFILAVAMGQAGVAVCSPRVNRKGTSLRGEIMLEHLSSVMNWHFAG